MRLIKRIVPYSFSTTVSSDVGANMASVASARVRLLAHRAACPRAALALDGFLKFISSIEPCLSPHSNGLRQSCAPSWVKVHLAGARGKYRVHHAKVLHRCFQPGVQMKMAHGLGNAHVRASRAILPRVGRCLCFSASPNNPHTG